jgi:hypothetical protein
VIVALLLAACAELPEPFHVTLSFPADGDDAFPETPVRIGFSEAIDRDACLPAIALVAVDDAGSVAWPVPFELTDGDDPDAFDLEHDPFVAQIDHALTVASGPSGCVSATGLPLEPFAATFHVLERP